jgi:hypothetical protein
MAGYGIMDRIRCYFHRFAQMGSDSMGKEIVIVFLGGITGCKLAYVFHGQERFFDRTDTLHTLFNKDN